MIALIRLWTVRRFRGALARSDSKHWRNRRHKDKAQTAQHCQRAPWQCQRGHRHTGRGSPPLCRNGRRKDRNLRDKGEVQTACHCTRGGHGHQARAQAHLCGVVPHVDRPTCTASRREHAWAVPAIAVRGRARTKNRNTRTGGTAQPQCAREHRGANDGCSAVCYEGARFRRDSDDRIRPNRIGLGACLPAGRKSMPFRWSMPSIRMKSSRSGA